MGTIEKRPKWFDKVVTDEIASKLMPDVLKWLRDGGDLNPDEEEVLEDLQEMFESVHDHDGYLLARELDRSHYWNPDESLVEVLGRASSFSWDVTRKRVTAWVFANKITATHAVGAHVEFKSGRGTLKGTIVRIDADHAVYTIQEDGKHYAPLRKDSDFREGILVDFENVVGDVQKADTGSTPCQQ